MTRNQGVLLTGLGMALLGACAAGDPRFTVEDPAGFFVGLWHGLIAFVALVIGVFSDNVEVYERANTGGWYDLGFLLGVSAWGGGGAHQTRRAWCNGKERRAARLPAAGRLKVDVAWTSDEPASTDRSEPPAPPDAGPR